MISADVTREPGYRLSRSTRAVRSELAVPINGNDAPWGVINLEDTELNAFDEDDARLLESVAAQLAGTLNSIGLYERLDRAYLGTAEALRHRPRRQGHIDGRPLGVDRRECDGGRSRGSG